MDKTPSTGLGGRNSARVRTRNVEVPPVLELGRLLVRRSGSGVFRYGRESGGGGSAGSQRPGG